MIFTIIIYSHDHGTNSYVEFQLGLQNSINTMMFVNENFRDVMPPLLRLMLTAHTFFFFLFFSPKLSYVPFVLACDHLGKLVMEK